MNQHLETTRTPAPRAPVFFWITVSLIGVLVLGAIALTVLLVFEARSINQSGGWGWLLVIGIVVVVGGLASVACAVCTILSLLRRERYRTASIVILVISCLVMSAFGPIAIRAVISLRSQRAGAARIPQSAPGQPVNSAASPATPEVRNPQILELKTRLWAAIRAKDAGAFADCFLIEEQFNTPEIREENRKQMEILLRGETIDVEIRDIPASELTEIMKVQNARPATLVRYSLVPRMMLWVRQDSGNGRVGRGFLIGEQNGKWYIVTLAGRPT